MTNNLLSICIPTYNRMPYIYHLVIELINQIKEANFEQIVEICISDNCSSDDTEVKLNPLIAANKFIKYIKLDKNMGADYNFYNVANMANNKYIWWFCSDDLPENDCLKTIVSFLEEQKPNITYLAHNLYSKNMDENYGLHPYLEDFKEKKQFVGIGDLINFGYMLGFIGAIIIKKSNYDSIDNKLLFNKSCYIHVAWILDSFINKDLTIHYYQNPIIKHRLNNDSFIQNDNIFNRMMIDVNGYKEIGRHFLNHNDFNHFYFKIYHKHIRAKLISLAKDNWLNCLKVYIINFGFMYNTKIFYKDLTKIVLKLFR